MKTREQKQIIIEGAVILALAVTTYILGHSFDIFEKLAEFAENHEEWELDEILSTALVISFTLFAILIRRWKSSTKMANALKANNQQLEKTLNELQELKGILPLCSYCKKIRDDSGYWEQVDVYIDKHSQADISHSICPSCLKNEYPEVFNSLDEHPAKT